MNRAIHRRCLLGWLWLALMAASGTALADTTCTFSPVSALAFGTTSSSTGAVDSTATFNITCTTTGLALLSTVRVRTCLSIDAGVSGGGNYVPRQMTNGFGDVMQMQLYTDSARSQIWGSRNSTAAPNPRLLDFSYTILALGASQTQTVTLYGRIPGLQSLAVGDYSNAFTGLNTSIVYAYNEQVIGTAPMPASCVAPSIGNKTATGVFPFTATANVQPQCSTYVTNELYFGNVTGNLSGTLATPIDQTTSIGLTCTRRAAYTIGLNNGLYNSGSTRRMRMDNSTSAFITYEMYRDAARSQRWGTQIGTDTHAGTGSGGAQSVTVYGRVPAGQNVLAGQYQDTVTVTITY